ncbi:hypothetical protein FB192DRAFT_1081998 [Mucor lusitanicus]|uniref:Uncharacterized protein n=1 Tax=Mucor circinelloides f. lusitanicus TaxID=29924 RepID=A0A8H4BJV7_MUCCL|nr:hypothetical protein FB192DRAFT_1081998 [Mucor lusitanicus]
MTRPPTACKHLQLSITGSIDIHKQKRYLADGLLGLLFGLHGGIGSSGCGLSSVVNCRHCVLVCVAVAMVFETIQCINKKKNKRIRFLRDPPIYNPHTEKKNFQSPSAQRFFIISNSIRCSIFGTLIKRLICLFERVRLSCCSFLAWTPGLLIAHYTNLPRR